MKNGDIMLGAAIGAVIVGAIVRGVERRRPEGARCPCGHGGPCEPCNNCEPCGFCEHCKPCGFCEHCKPCRLLGPTESPRNRFYCPPEEKPKKKDSCKECYYEKYERKRCGR